MGDYRFCKDCADRHYNCWGKCPKYLEEKMRDINYDLEQQKHDAYDVYVQERLKSSRRPGNLGFNPGRRN